MFGKRAGWGAGSFLVVVVGACGSPVPPWCDAPPPARRVIFRADSRASEPLRLRALWEVRPAGGQGLRGPRAIAIDPGSGAVAVADHVRLSVDFISADGTVGPRWAGPETGPGRLSSPAALDWMADGSIAVLDPILRKIIRMDAGGRFLDEFPLLSGPDADLPDWWLLLRGSDIIGVPAPRLVEADGIPAVVMSLLRFGSYGARVDTILSSTVEAPPGTISSPSPPPGMPLPVAAVLPGGLLAVAGDIPEFRIRVLTPQGEVVRVTCRVPSAAERSDGGRRLAPIGRLFSDGDGRVWAQRGGVAGMRVQDRWFGPPGATFDLFDVDGDYLGHVRAPKDTRLAAAHRGVVMGFRADSDGAVSVVSFRLEAPSAAGETPAN